MGLPVAELRSRAVEAALLSADELGTFEAALPKPCADAEAFAKELVRAKRLTSYQAQALLQNKAKALVLGEYVVLDKLGQGGMGMVLKAEHRRMKRVVALKVLSPNLTRTAAAVARFHREVQAAARLNHPHVVTAFDAGESKGVHYLVMEYVDGKDLSSLVKSVGPMAVDDAVRCVRQAALGLQYAHENGVVHRDIKPANLLLDKSGHVKILDMGLARIEDAESKGEELTASGQIMGTAEYMSPEQALDTRHADARSDVYSLGCALFYLLTGRSVYGGDTALKKILAHRDAPIPSLVEAVREKANAATNAITSNVAKKEEPGGSRPPLASDALLRAVDALFRKMVAKSPADRPQTMAEVVAGLDRCLSQPEIAANEDSESTDSHLHAFLRHMSEEQSLASLSPRTLPPSRGPNPGPGLEDLVQKLPGAQAVAAARPDPASKPTAESQGNRSTQPDRGANAAPDKQPPLDNKNSPGAANELPPKTAAARGASRKKSSPASPGPAWRHDRRVQLGLGGIAVFVVVLAAIGISAFRGRPAPTGKGLDGATHVADPNGGTDPVVDGNGPHASPPKTDFANDAQAPPPAVAPFDATAAKAHQAAWAKHLGEPVETTNSIGMRFVVIPPGKLTMGDGANTVPVELTRPFRIGIHEVTQGQYWSVMGAEPWKGMGDVREGTDHAASHVSWEEAVAFCRKLTEQERTAGDLSANEEYRLPTEAEWEWACRAGTTTNYSFGDDLQRLGGFAWYDANAKNAGESYAHAVGLKKPNAWGLFDVHGNVWEWCGDWNGTKLSGGRDPVGPSEGSGRVYRGGGWFSTAGGCRSAYRNRVAPEYRNGILGIRVARTLAMPKVAASSGPADPAFFNGQDLTGWVGEPSVWKVANGEIVGTLPPGRTSGAYLFANRTLRDFELRFDLACRLTGTQYNECGLRFRSLADPAKFSLGLPGCNLPDGAIYNPTRVRDGTGKAQKTVPPGEYTSIVFRCVGRRVTISANGQLVQDWEGDIPESGVVGWHLKHGVKEMRLRSVRFVDLSPPTNAAFFNGRDLTGWVGDPAVWRVDKGEIVGTNADRGNHYLKLDRVVRDFEVSFEARVTYRRSEARSDAGGAFRFRTSDASNYQAVLLGDDPTLSLTRRDGRMTRTARAEAVSASMRPDGYNAYRIHVVGDAVTIHVNDLPNPIDAAAPLASGEILWSLAPNCAELRVRNVRLVDLSNASVGATTGDGRPWRTLFNGRDLTGWKHFNGSVAADWSMEDGSLVNLARPEKKWDSHLATAESFREFVFRCEFRLAKGAYGKLNLGGAFVDLADVPHGHDGGESGTIRNLGGTNWLKAKGSVYRVGDWNALEVRRQGKSFRVTLNGTVVNDRTDTTDPVAKPVAVTQFTQRAELRNLEIEPLPSAEP